MKFKQNETKMDKKTIITTLFVLVTMAGWSQTEPNGSVMSEKETDVHPFVFDMPMMADSMRFQQKSVFLELPQDIPQKTLTHDRMMPSPISAMPATTMLTPWHKANFTVYGATGHMTGLMDIATGALSLHQDFGRLHFTASAIANKYWMPMQGQLYTQYGFGGTLGYDLTDAISFHAFGYYYANNPLVGPAFNPYVSTTSFGGSVNIRFNDIFRCEVGVRRYINPMSGRWTTSPIVTPYLRVGKRSKMDIALPLGEWLKDAIWGDRDNPMHFRPQPQPQPRKK